MILFGIVGYLMQKLGFEPAPLVLAYVLSPMLETALRQSLNISGGSFIIFFSRPISLVCMLIFLGLLAFQLYSHITKKGPIIPAE
jgi:putative tricarboxylic transport membrane protein